MTASPIARAALIALIAASLAATGCVRSRGDPYAPLAGALVRFRADTVTRVFAELRRAFQTEGIGVKLIDDERRMVESEWVDVASLARTAGAERLPSSERRVKFRLRAREVPGGSEIVAESIYSPFFSDSRRDERMAPPEHPAWIVLRRMLEAGRER